MVLESDQVASFLDAEHVGESRLIDGVNSLRRASDDELTYCTTYDTDAEIAASNAGVIVAPETVTDHPSATLVRTADPRTAFVRVADEFLVPDDDRTTVHPTATIEEGAEIGENCTVGPHVFVGENVVVGDRVHVQAGTSIGGDALVYAREDDGRLVKHVQTGGVVIGDDVEIGSNCSIDRAVFEETVIGEGTKLDNLVHVAHDDHIGADVTIPAGVTFAGHVRVEDHVRLNPEVSVAAYVTIHEGAEIGMNSTVLDDVEAYTTVVGSPAEPVGPSRFAP